MASKCGESDAPLTDVLRLASWLTYEVVRCLLNVDDDVVCGKSNEGMKLTERGMQKISDTWGAWLHLIVSRMRCKKHGHEVLMDAHWLTGMSQHEQSHVVPMTSFGEGIP